MIVDSEYIAEIMICASLYFSRSVYSALAADRLLADRLRTAVVIVSGSISELSELRNYSWVPVASNCSRLLEFEGAGRGVKSKGCSASSKAERVRHFLCQRISRAVTSPCSANYDD